MLRRLLNRHSLRTAAPFYLAMLLLVLSGLVLLAGGFFFYSLFRVEKEDELDTRLQAIGLAAAPGIAQVAEFTMLSLLDEGQVSRDWVEWFELIAQYDEKFVRIGERLRDLLTVADLESVQLISLQGYVIADAEGKVTPGRPAPLLQVDLFAWEPAVAGRTASTPYYELNGVPHKRFYVPVRLPDTDGARERRVGAVLRLEASLDAAREIARLRTQVLVVGGVVTFFMATVALLFYRLIRAFARLTETAAHRDRLQAMGTLTAGIAHEIRNPLGIIRALAEGLAGDFEPDDPGREMLSDIVDEVERLNRLVGQYLAFARPNVAAPGEQARPDEALRDLAHLLHKNDQQRATVEVAIDPGVPPVAMNDSALRQVLLNVLLNAREASPPGQPIHARVQTVRGGAAVEIVIADKGPGIPARDLKRVFEPFFTTKTRGSGLGLAISRNLVADCKGHIEITSREGEGTTVRIVLPAGRAV